MSGLGLRDVTVRYGDTTALDGVSMAVAPGEVVALLGVLAVGLGAPVWALSLALAVVALGSTFTVGQRIHAAWKGLRLPAP